MASLAFALALVIPLPVRGLISHAVIIYWGQNSYGGTHLNDTAGWQKTLSFYCQDGSIDVFPLAFLNVAFDTGGLPSMDFSNICNVVDSPVFPGTALPNCPFLASDIQECQANGKIVTISIGGVGFNATLVSLQTRSGISSWEAQATCVHLATPSSMDCSVDLDLEQGSGSYWPAFVNQIRSHASGDNKTYYITAAPQCPFPDALMGDTINAVGFDAIYVQFYNNFCGLQAFDNTSLWNFAQWHDWATNVSPNKNVKVYIGAPADPLAAGSGYVDADTLARYALQTRSQFSSFGGVTLWDASGAYANGDFSASIKRALSDEICNLDNVVNPSELSIQAILVPTPSLSASTQGPLTVTTTSGSPSSSPISGSCGVVAPWVANVTYEGGKQVSYAWHKWTAKWQNNDDVPGGSSGAWEDKGLCNTAGDREAIKLAPSPVSETAPAERAPKMTTATKAHWHRDKLLRHTHGHF